MEQILTTLGIPGTIITVILLGYALLNALGELIELKGKIVPEWMKIRKFFQRRKAQETERLQALKDVKVLLTDTQTLLNDVNSHYNADNIKCRNEWITQVNNTMTWVHEKAESYDTTLKELKADFQDNKIISEMLYVQNCRTTILDFASKVGRPDYIATKDEFKRVFNVYRDYEAFLEAHHMENGEVDDAMEIIHEEHRDYLRNNRFLEARRSNQTND